MSDAAIRIVEATAAQAAACPGIEARAARLFSAEDLDPRFVDETWTEAEYVEAAEEGRLLVATLGSVVVGFALLSEIDGHPHLEELDVDPDYGRRGIGRQLLEAAIARAAASGAGEITLSTFEHLAWNAPFYASAGFEVLPPEAWTEALRTLRANEAGDGLDPAKRVVMTRRLA